jgi:hypothetical protein
MDGSRLTLRAALAADRLEDFVRQEEAHGVELEIGSDFERALALLLVQRDLCQERQHGPGPGSPRVNQTKALRGRVPPAVAALGCRDLSDDAG